MCNASSRPALAAATGAILVHRRSAAEQPANGVQAPAPMRGSHTARAWPRSWVCPVWQGAAHLRTMHGTWHVPPAHARHPRHCTPISLPVPRPNAAPAAQPLRAQPPRAIQLHPCSRAVRGIRDGQWAVVRGKAQVPFGLLPAHVKTLAQISVSPLCTAKYVVKPSLPVINVP